jgi:hypothetical protein
VRAAAAGFTVVAVAASLTLQAHDGPPFPIVSDHIGGPYRISIWTDPDTTDDGSAGGQFWVRVQPVGTTQALPEQTRATVTIAPLDRSGPQLSVTTAPVRGDVTNQFAALVMDHEGRFAVRVGVDGPLGTASVNAAVDATYDARPAPGLLILYVLPFVLVGVLWGRLLVRRRTLPGERDSTHPRVP